MHMFYDWTTFICRKSFRYTIFSLLLSEITFKQGKIYQGILKLGWTERFHKTFRLFWIVIFQRSPQYCCKIEILTKYWNKNKSKINGLRCFMFLKMFHFGLRSICHVIFGIFLWLLNNPNTGCPKWNQIVTYFWLSFKSQGKPPFIVWQIHLNWNDTFPLHLCD